MWDGGLPSEKACNLVHKTYMNHIDKYPNAKLIDFGAGNGVFSFVFNELGIPKNKIVAIDLPIPSHTSDVQRIFWDIHREKYYINPEDILFISWGIKCFDVVDDYITRMGII